MYYRPKSTPENPDWHYLAGLWDGEGCVAVSSINRKKKNGSIHSYWNFQLQMTNTSEVLVRSLADDFGGAAYLSVRKYEKRKSVHMWFVFSAKECLRILNSILPLLRYKGEEARLAIEFFEGKINRSKDGSGAVPPHEIDNRNRIALAIRSLEGRRKMPHTNTRLMEHRPSRRRKKGQFS